ncbi:hypothetical protein QQ045_025109 [Rhodiola kirilowii]
MTTIMASIVKSSWNTGNLKKMNQTMEHLVTMEVQAEFMWSSMVGSTSLSTAEGDVSILMHRVVDEDDLRRRLTELKARG